MDLDVFIGEWSIDAAFPSGESGGEPGRATFEWMAGGKFLIQRWEAPDPAPDGLAVIGFDEGRGTHLQHYFDSRGVARVYEMSLEDGVWRLWRNTPDFSPLSFHQRFSGEFGDGGRTIRGPWEISHDEGATWEHDFELTYTKLSAA